MQLPDMLLGRVVARARTRIRRHSRTRVYTVTAMAYKWGMSGEQNPALSIGFVADVPPDKLEAFMQVLREVLRHARH